MGTSPCRRWRCFLYNLLYYKLFIRFIYRLCKEECFRYRRYFRRRAVVSGDAWGRPGAIASPSGTGPRQIRESPRLAGTREVTLVRDSDNTRFRSDGRPPLRTDSTRLRRRTTVERLPLSTLLTPSPVPPIKSRVRYNYPTPGESTLSNAPTYILKWRRLALPRPRVDGVRSLVDEPIEPFLSNDSRPYTVSLLPFDFFVFYRI